MAKRKPSADELDLWRHVTRDAKPLRARSRPKPAADAAEKPEPAAARPAQKAAPQAPLPPRPKPPPPELATGRIAGVDKRLAERLKRGQLPIEASLDLHGLTQGEAHDRLVAFNADSAAAGRRCVVVITGKGAWREGAGVLREAVPRWLNEPPNRARVLAISQSQPRHGGGGALYLLLKRMREA